MAGRRVALATWQFVRLMVRLEESRRQSGARRSLHDAWRDDWETLAALLGKLEKDYQAPASVDGVLKALSSEVEAFNGQSFGSIGDQGIKIIDTGVTIPLIEQEKARVASGQING